MVKKARKHGIRIIGPNCIGILNPKTRVDTLFQSRKRCLRPKPGDIAFIAQSGTFSLTLIEWMAESNLGLSKMVSYGNMADVTDAELIEYLTKDPQTSIILCYMESTKNGRELVNAIKKASKTKPVIILKSGRSKEGVKAAKSHTGGLAGEYKIFKSALEQAGGIVVDSLEELFLTAKVLKLQPLPKGNKTIMITNGAGPSVLALDYMSQTELASTSLSPDAVQRLKSQMPGSYILDKNPIDLTGSASSRDYQTVLNEAIHDSNVDIIITLFVFQDTPLDEGIIPVMEKMNAAAHKKGKPIVSWAAGGFYTRTMVKRLEKAGIPVFSSPQIMIKVLENTVKRSKYLFNVRNSRGGH